MAGKVFVGNLHRDTDASDIKRAFERFGDVDDVSMKEGFAFVHMKDQRDADDAVKSLHEKDIGSSTRVRVEHPKERRGGGGGGGGGRDCYNCGRPGHFARECREGGGRGGGRDGGYGGGRDGGYGGGRDGGYGGGRDGGYGGRDGGRGYGGGRDDRGYGGRDGGYGGRDGGYRQRSPNYGSGGGGRY